MGIELKKTQKLTRTELKKVLAVSSGREKADLLIKNVKILDVVNGLVTDSNIVIAGKTIAGIGPEYSDAKAHEIYDGQGRYVTPGFIDAHLHVESSLMHPFEFEKETLPLGTTTIVCDPHEITNVLGKDGVEWFLRCSDLTDQNQFVQISSCVPALKGFETNGGEFELSDMIDVRDHSSVLGIGEMMNFPGVIGGHDDVLDKIEAFEDLSIDGHCPLLRGKDLNAYIAGGVHNCHETILFEEGQEKLAKGMNVIIREGTVAKNLKNLAPLINEFNSMQCMLCTDDRNPYEIEHDGHIDSMIRYLINEQKLPVHVAYRVATLSPANHFRLHRLGMVAPGKQADLVFLDDLESVSVQRVMVKGSFVDKDDLDKRAGAKFGQSNPPTQNTINRKPLEASAFNHKFEPATYNVMEIVPGEIITKHLKLSHDGNSFEVDDVLKISVVERYGNEQAPSIGFVKGIGLKSGALAASVAHDCHNIIVMGTNDEDMAYAVNQLIESGGGFCVVNEGKLIHKLELPIAGLMSLKPANEIVEDQMKLYKGFKDLGVVLDAPFLQMAFLALPVIPTLKLTDKGLFDINTFSFMDLKE